MSLKDIFQNSVEKIAVSKNLQKLYDEVESEGYVEEISKKNDRYLPNIDFTTASNFARYGSAEKYYSDSIKNIYNNYPYDGSRKEKQEWRNNSSQFDLYVYDNIYPKTTGYINLGQNVVYSSGYRSSSLPQYILAYGGPNTSSANTSTSIKEVYKYANIYDLTENRESNLGITEEGNTVEFWFKDNTPSSSSPTNVFNGQYALFDLWNGQASGSSNYTRLYIARWNGSNRFLFNYVSGTSGVTANTNGYIDYSLDHNNWHHYAFVFKNNSINNSDLDISIYIDGQFATSKTINGVGKIKLANNKGLKCSIGSRLATNAGVSSILEQASGSFDEFRFWKEARTSQEIARNWFTTIAGGTNTDNSNTKLGLYFKFNEGIIGNSSIDSKILDYSGRISNGNVSNYTTNVRNTGSAINSYSSNYDEEKDPIIYSLHPSVQSVLTTYTNSGSLWDEENNSNIYKSLPSWITDEQEKKGSEDLNNLIQIISSYFDTLHLQIENLPKIKDVEYISNQKPLPFIDRILSSYDFQNLDLFNSTTFLEEVLSRNDTLEFDKSVTDIKNTIYQNIYNNLVYIYKSKGTENSLRNLIRCFGIDDELVKINLYANNQQFLLEDKYQYVSTPKKFIDFNNTDRYNATIYQKNNSSDSNTRGYIAGDSSGRLSAIPITLQAEIIFPKKLESETTNSLISPFTTISLFGAHTANDLNESDLTWGNDEFNLSITAEKSKIDSKDVYFKLSGALSGSSFNLTSSLYSNVYNNEKWNFAVRIKQKGYEFANVSGSSDNDYQIEFIGINSSLDSVLNSFSVSSVIPKNNASSALSKPKRIYAGAHFTDFNTSSTVLARTDIKISSVRFWFDYLTDEEILAHSYDASSFGRKYPYWYLNSYNSSINNLAITKADTLALNWDFNLVTGSNSSGQFIVEDASSGSNIEVSKPEYGWFGNISKKRHTGLGNNFYPNDPQSVNKEYIYSAKLSNPENIAGSQLIDIIPTDDILYERKVNPITYFYSLEKSMYQVINSEIINWLATIQSFNNLIGEPLERYRSEYKNLEQLRKIFFNKVQDNPNFEKFLEFYKWIDSSISLMVTQLIPASANFSENIRNVVESHLLERNKFENKLPLIAKSNDPIAKITSFLNFSYENYHAPSSPAGDGWLKQRAERNSSILTSGDGVLDAQREQLRQVINNSNLNPLPVSYDIATSQIYYGKRDFSRIFTKLNSITSSVMISQEDIIRPVSISNNVVSSSFVFAENNVTASGQLFNKLKSKGNYFNKYEYFQTSGRSNNNKALPDIVDNLNLTSSNIFGTTDRTLPTRPVIKTIFVERFSAPGGPEVNSRGALDAEAEEYSVYNGLNNRNLLVRKNLNKWLAESSSYDQENPSFHKVNKNTNYRLLSDNTSKISYDNAFITTQIPRSDHQYLWITSSLLNKPSTSGYFGNYDNISFNSSSLTFLSGTSTRNYAGLNFGNVIKNINTASNTIDVQITSSSDFTNHYLSNLNGPYQGAGWKQIRNEQNKIVQLSRKNNNILVQNKLKPILSFDNSGNPVYNSENRSQNFTSYKEPPVTYNLPMKHIVKVLGSIENIELTDTYDNNKEKFVNKNLASNLGVKERNEKQVHDILNDLENSNYLEKPSILKAKYSQIIFPKKEIIGLKEIRTKPNYDDNGFTGSVVNEVTYWRDEENNRARGSNTYDIYEINKNEYGDVDKNINIIIYNTTSSLNSRFKINLDNIKNSIFGIDSTLSSSYSSDFFNIAFSQDETVLKNPVVLRDGRFFKVDALNYVTSITSGANGIYYFGYDTSAGNNWYLKVSSSSGITTSTALFNSSYNGFSVIVSGSSYVYMGGQFSNASGSNITRWNGTTWSNVGGGLNDRVYSLITTSNGIYAGGNFYGGASGNYVSRFDGTSWNPVGGGFNSPCYALVSGSDGIYAGGSFTGGVSRFDGTSWNSLSPGLTYPVEKLLSSSTDGVYATGYYFDYEVNKYVSKVSVWKNSNWTQLGDYFFYRVQDIASSSKGLYAGIYTPGVRSAVLYKWNGYKWQTNFTSESLYSPSVQNLLATPDGNLYMNCIFPYIIPNSNTLSYEKNILGNLNKTNILLNKQNIIADNKYFLNSMFFYNIKYNNFYNEAKTTSTIYPQGYNSYDEFNDHVSCSEGIYIASRTVYPYAFRWDGSTLIPLIDVNNSINEPNSSCFCVVSASDGVYFGGAFNNVGNNIARWDGTKWNNLGSGLNNTVNTLALGARGVYAGGNFTGTSGNYISRWDGTNWNPVGGGLGSRCYRITLASDSSPTSTDSLYVSSYFSGANIAYWNKTSWNKVVDGLGNSPAGNTALYNPNLFYVNASPRFSIISTEIYANDLYSDALTKWDGSNWIRYPKVEKSPSDYFAVINSVLSNSSGLYIGGRFTSSSNNSITCYNFAKFDGEKWTSLGRHPERGLSLEDYNSIEKMSFTSENEILATGRLSSYKSGPLIADINNRYSVVEGYKTSKAFIVPSPQLMFNNFIPPISGSIKLEIFDRKNNLTFNYNNSNGIFLLNEGYVYETENKSNNKAFFDSYEDFTNDLKPKSKKYSIIPEYTISDYVNNFVKFNTFTKTSNYLKINGSITDINNIIYIDNYKNILNKNIDNINIKVSGIKKVLPKRDFYPSERILTLSKYFLNSFIQLYTDITSSWKIDDGFTQISVNGNSIDKQILSLIQPLFSPGILLNTIKSSIAVDWPIYIKNAKDAIDDPQIYSNTGSNLISTSSYNINNGKYYPYTASNYINEDPTFRLPFESILELDTIIPENLRIGSKALYYLNPSNYTSDLINCYDQEKIVYPSYNMGTGSLTQFKFLDSNYKLAMHNFLAEIPNFFLKNKLNKFVSKNSKVYAKKNVLYSMDIVLEKSKGFKQYLTDPFLEGKKSLINNFNDNTVLLPSVDSIFGPPSRYWISVNNSKKLFNQNPYNLYSKLLDSPAYAPYVPPYFYGKSIARVTFTPEETREWTIPEIIEKCTFTYINDEAQQLFKERSNILDSELSDNYSSSPAYKNIMNISSSLNLKLLTTLLTPELDAKNYQANTVSKTNDKSWVIQTKFETPAINFSNVDLSDNIGLNFKGGTDNIPNDTINGIFSYMFKGLWTSYGTPSDEKEGIILKITNSPNVSDVNSLAKLCGFDTSEVKQIGALANEKNIYEGVVLIPYTSNKNQGEIINNNAETVFLPIGETEINLEGNVTDDSYYYFKLDRDILKQLTGLSFDKNSKVTFEQIKAKVESNEVDSNNSIIKLIKSMTKFVIPPHLDWLRNKNIDPFVMYIFEFDVRFDREDLSDIWQGLMPKASKIATEQDVTINHKFTKNEMFHGKNIPNDLKFKIFKVKQKANINYYQLTEDSTDDSGFKFTFGNSPEAQRPEYSYNWPYDFMSIVELANVEITLEEDKDKK